MLITNEHFEGQIDLFNETFPDGAEFNKTNWNLASSVGLQVSWMYRFLDEPARKIYEEATESAWKIYEEAQTLALFNTLDQQFKGVKQMLITNKHLEGACQDQIDLFNETFPDGAEFNKTNWDLALSLELQVGWMEGFLDDSAWKIYEEAKIPAWKIYEEAEALALFNALEKQFKEIK